MMEMNGVAIGPQASVYQEPNAAWRIMGPTEYAQQ
jgi:hypothetical protein